LLDSYPNAIRATYATNPDVLEALWYPWNMALRQSPEFQGLVEDLGLLDFWRVRGFPDLCKEEEGQLVCQ
jgi:hypothetical protein